MAVNPFRLRRALSLSFSLLHHSLHRPRPITSSTFSHLVSAPNAAAPSSTQLTRPFTSTATLFRKTFDPETEEIGPDTILFEGCDYNHWLITMEFPKDSNLTREQMIEAYVNTAAQVFGSVEEAKKKIYALSTTTYQGFQVECSEEISEKFKGIPGVVFILPDSYIDPVNKEYGGDKYINGEIIPRPPPVHYGRRNNRDRRPREQNYGPPPQQNYGPPQQQNYGPSPPQQNYGRHPPQQNYGPPPPQQNYRPPPPQQNYGPPPPQQNYRHPQQGYAPRPHQSYAPPPQQNYAPNSQQSYGNSPNFPPEQYHTPAGSWERSGSTLPNNASGDGERNSMPPNQGSFNQVELGNTYAQGQRNLQSHVPPEQRGFPQDANYGFSEGGSFEHVSGGQRHFSSTRNN